jgi:hypothetical protein
VKLMSLRSGILVAATMAVVAATAVNVPTVGAEPASCDVPSCVPGIKGGAVLGAPCDDTGYYVFGTTSWGRLVFCGSPRRYAPRYFRSPPMVGVKAENAECQGYENSVAQAPDGLFLMCVAANGSTTWVRGDA